MKTKLFAPLFGCLLSVIMIKSGFAQHSGSDISLHYQFVYDTSNSGLSPTHLDAVKSSVIHTFYTTFANAENVTWQKVKSSYFLASFTQNGKETRALFTNKGTLKYAITYGTEKDLPAETRRLVKREYIDFAISMATEVKENDRDVWVIRLEDADNMIFVSVENGELEEINHYQKSK